MRVLRLLLAAFAILGFIDASAAQYARPTFDDDDDFGYVPPATTAAQKPIIQPIQPQVLLASFIPGRHFRVISLSRDIRSSVEEKSFA